jgi:Nickel responsive protein SCO4226-like
MPLYVIERAFAEELELTSEDVRLIDEVNADEGVQWLFSFLSADRRHTYCLYEAPSPDAILAAAKRANVPADAIVEVGPASPELTPRLRDWALARS